MHKANLKKINVNNFMLEKDGYYNYRLILGKKSDMCADV